MDMSTMIVRKVNLMTDETHEHVSLRFVHENLEVRKDFTDWAKVQIKRFDFVENVDFVKLPLKGEHVHGGHNKVDYHTTFRAAKMILAGSQTKGGDQMIRYLVEFEEDVRQGRHALYPTRSAVVNPSQGIIDGLAMAFKVVGDALQTNNGLIEAVAGRLEGIAADVHQAVTQTKPCRTMTISEYLREHAITMSFDERKECGGELKRLANERGYPETRTAPSRTYPRGINKYRVDLLEEVVTARLANA